MSSSSPSVVSEKLVGESTAAAAPVNAPPRRGATFWFAFLAICVSLFQAGFELFAVSTALPTIAKELNSNNFVWVGSAYALASACAIPMMGGFAQAFGRQSVMLVAIVVFAIGSAICGASTTMSMLIAGRTVQGFGGGQILAISQIIVSDLVSLRERGKFNGIIGVTWAIAIVTAAIVGGELAEHGQWRWIFYMNLPISAFAFALVVIFLKTRKPQDGLMAKLSRLDWVGNFLIIASTVSISIAITTAGVSQPWSSARTLAPLILGVVGLGAFLAYDGLVADHPLVPFHLLSNRTSLIGYLLTFLTNLIVVSGVFYMQVYLQACREDTPIQSGGRDWVGIAVVTGPFCIIGGVLISVIHRYREVIWTAWIFLLIGQILFSIAPINPRYPLIIGYEVMNGVGSGILLSTTYFPVLAPLPVTSNARALAFFSFCRVFGQIWAVTIGASILQNELTHRLPPGFLAQLPAGIELSYTAIPAIPTLPPDVKIAVQIAFRDSLRVLWRTMTGVAGFALLASLLMKEVPMHAYTDNDWGIEEDETSTEAKAVKV